MNINYLILAYSNFKTLDSIIEALDNDNVNFYIHIDKKTKFIYSHRKSNVYLLKNRYAVNWGRFGMINATLELLKESFMNEPNHDSRFVLLSGADYPIRPNIFIEEILNTEWEYINLSPAPLPHKPMSRFQYFHFDYDRRNKKNIKTLSLYMLEKTLATVKLKRNIPFKIYCGSQWFALTNKCVAYILNQVNKNPDYINFFKYTHIPDEAFFQTIIGNSSFFKKVKCSLTYSDWSSNPAPARMTQDHIDLFNTSISFNGCYGNYTPLFARKFDDDNLHLINKINETLRKQLPNTIMINKSPKQSN